MKQHLSRLDQVAAKLNVWLLVIALGLAVLDFSVLVVKAVEALPPPGYTNSTQTPANPSG